MFLSLPAPAKINRFLHIVEKKENYHMLQTLFQYTTLCDNLTFKRADTLSITGMDIPAEENIVYKAVRAFEHATNLCIQLHIHIDKFIPMGGGCGGGSSNAATTLMGLNTLYNAPLSLSELHQIGAQLGADVPFFLYGKSAWGEGRGDILTPASPPEEHMLLVFPPVHCSTAVMYQHPQLTRDTPRVDIADIEPPVSHNDFQPLAIHLYPEIAQTLAKLGARARLNGSGCSIFLRGEISFLEGLAKQFPLGYTSCVVYAVNHSPLHKTLLEKDIVIENWGVAKR